LLELCRREAAGHKRKFRFKHKLLSIDSTTIALSLSMFDWAHPQLEQCRIQERGLSGPFQFGHTRLDVLDLDGLGRNRSSINPTNPATLSCLSL
jgi:hypothetical protein